MTRIRKYSVGVIVYSLLLTACSSGPSTPPMGTVGAPTLTPVDPTVSPSSTYTVPSPPVSIPAFAPTTTANTLAPRPTGCVQDGVDTQGWNTDPDDSGDARPSFLGPLAPPSLSTGPCFDKLVFTVSTGAGVEFSARYVPVVIADGSGLQVNDIKGNAFIQLVIKAHMLRDEQGNPLYDPADYNVADSHGYGSLRELRLVTPDYEGYTTFGIGVDSQTPFAVESHLVGGEKTEIDVYLTRPVR